MAEFAEVVAKVRTLHPAVAEYMQSQENLVQGLKAQVALYEGIFKDFLAVTDSDREKVAL